MAETTGIPEEKEFQARVLTRLARQGLTGTPDAVLVDHLVVIRRAPIRDS